MDKQLTMSALTDELGSVRTHKKEFLAQIERIVPWGEWIALIKPYYYKYMSESYTKKKLILWQFEEAKKYIFRSVII